MGGGVHGFEMVNRHMRVNLRGGQALMAENGLNDARIRPVL